MRRVALLSLTLALACAGSTPATTPTSARPTEESSDSDRAPSKHEAKHAHGKHDHAHGSHTKHAHGDREYRQHKMPHRFTGAEDWAKRFDNPKRDAWQKPALVIESMKISANMVVADIGAGTGYFVPHLSKAVGPQGKVMALDVEDDMVRYLGERAKREGLGNVNAGKIPMDSPGLEPSSTDRILIVNTWHHIGDRSAYAAKLKASLRPGGAVYVVDFHPHSKKGPPKKHKLAPSVVTGELRAGGFEVELVLDALPEQYIAIGRVAP